MVLDRYVDKYMTITVLVNEKQHITTKQCQISENTSKIVCTEE